MKRILFIAWAAVFALALGVYLVAPMPELLARSLEGALSVNTAMLLVFGVPFSNVAATGVASCSMPLGMSYNRFILVLSGGAFTRAMITDIKVRLNGKVIFQNTGTRIQSINSYRGLGSTATICVVDFTEPRLKMMADQYLGNLNTAKGVTNLTMEVTIAGATTPGLACWYELNGPAPLGVLAKQILFSATFGAAGKFPFKLIDAANAGALVKRIHFDHTGHITALEVKKNGIVIFDTVTTAVNTAHQLDYLKTAQANLFTYDPIVDNNGSNMIVTKDARTFETNPTTDAAETATAVLEVVDVLGNM